MKKSFVFLLAVVLVLSFTACAGKVPAGTYKMIQAPSASIEMLKDYTTLVVNADGTASLDVNFGNGMVDSTEVVFDTAKGIATFDAESVTYSVDGNKIIFEYPNGQMIFEKK